MNAALQIEWVGLGSMGSRMAPDHINNGSRVTGFDLDHDRVAAAAAHGIKEAPSVAALPELMSPRLKRAG
jgi:3-hydroxyisobutyrate dehydrogenase-like beta-hydroxyacid dehydrogenase